MSISIPSELPDLRRIVTSHDSQGKSTVESDTLRRPQPIPSIPGVVSARFWVTTDSVPTNDTNTSEDGGDRKIDDTLNFGLVHPNGINLQYTDLAPGTTAPMHRTTSVDYNILIHGELILITEDGKETHLKNPGDTVIQKGTMHAWKNPSSTGWARWMTALIAAKPAIVDGKELN